MDLNWDWEASPTYESDRIKIDATHSPAVLYDMRRPRQLEDREVSLMLSLADLHLDAARPFIALVPHQRGTGVISGRHREAFSQWIEDRRGRLQRDDFGVVIVMPEPISRAVLRVVYRFRQQPLRTLTTPDLASAADVFRVELSRIGYPATPGVNALLRALLG